MVYKKLFSFVDMKNIFKILIPLAFITLSFSSFISEPIKEISVDFVMEVIADSNSELEETAKMMDGMEMKFKIKNKKFSMETKMAFMNISMITNDGNQYYMIMNMMGKKMAVKGTLDEMKTLSKQQAATLEEIKYVATNETKKIQGFNCKKYTANINVDGKTIQNVVWATDEIDASNELSKMGYNGITGFTLEAYTYANSLKTHMIAKNVTKGKIDDSVFELPDGYETMTFEELMKLQGGGK